MFIYFFKSYSLITENTYGIDFSEVQMLLLSYSQRSGPRQNFS